MMALRQQQQQQQQHQHPGAIAGVAQTPFLQWNIAPERGEATLQDFMEQQTNNSQAIVPAQMTR